MKNLIKIFVIIIFFFAIMISVNADQRQYEVFDETFTFEVNEEGVKLVNPEADEEKGSYVTKTYTYEYGSFEDYVKNVDSNKPFAMYICKYVKTESGPGMTNKRTLKYYFFPSEIEKENFKKEKYPNHHESNVFDECKYADEKFSNTSKKVCPTFDRFIISIEDILKEYKKCATDDNSCKTQVYLKFNSTKKQIEDVCSIISKYSSYSSQCLKDCLKMDTKIKEKITEANVVDFLQNKGTLQCGFSWNLINWIANIVKWGKYLIPVIVMVLGILDFIKAISSEKEDEMKKAQGGFVKRLIACALIFIIPFIIEFVLNKMGFDANGCGIIDL